MTSSLGLYTSTARTIARHVALTTRHVALTTHHFLSPSRGFRMSYAETRRGGPLGILAQRSVL